ncbi:MAG: type IV toxin-antitoxin system AbiEi family antitoxin domain-containing protein [Solirubrobacterales bacterium]
MHLQTTTANKLASIAEDQWGLLTRRQAEAAGVSAATLQRLSRPGGVLERTAHGVYHLAGAPLPPHPGLRSAWLALAPGTLAWERKPAQGTVSHRSAAALWGLGDLAPDRHEFTLPERRQTRQRGVRLHRGQLGADETAILGGLPVTSPARTASDLLADKEGPEAVARIITEALREKKEWVGNLPSALAPRAAGVGFRRDDWRAVLAWLLDLSGDPDPERWLEEAEAKSTDITLPSLDVP